MGPYSGAGACGSRAPRSGSDGCRGGGWCWQRGRRLGFHAPLHIVNTPIYLRPELFLFVVSTNQPCVGQACRAVAGRHLKPRRLRHALRRCVRIPQPSIFILFQPSARVHPSFLLGAQPFTRTERCSRSAETATPSRGWSHRSAPSPAFHGRDEVTIVALPLQGLPASCVSTQLWLP